MGGAIPSRSSYRTIPCCAPPPKPPAQPCSSTPTPPTAPSPPFASRSPPSASQPTQRATARAEAAPQDPIEGVVYHPIDHPFVLPETVTALLTTALLTQAPLVVPTWNGERGHPTFFSAGALSRSVDPALEGGARTVVHRRMDAAELLPVDDPGVRIDIDTPEQYAAVFAARGRTPAATDENRSSWRSASSRRDQRFYMTLSAADAAAFLAGAAETGGTAVVALVVGGAVPEAIGQRIALARGFGAKTDIRGSLADSGNLDARALALMHKALDDPHGVSGLRACASAPRAGRSLF